MSKEQTESTAEAAANAISDPPVSPPKAEEDKRERSTIEFPYNDLDDAVEVVKAIHDNAGVACTLDQLAAYLKQSMNSGTFRLRASNARVFGLTENERGTVTLTDLGRRIADRSQESAARADSFLQVPLYQRIYENYKGYTLPPASALEKFIRESGVASKQAGKARQAFMRSAKQAGFFTHGEDRLVRPATSGGEPGTKPIDAPTAEEEQKAKNAGGGDSEAGLDLDPLIMALLRKIPSAQEGWQAAKRVRWFRTFAMNVSQIYDAEEAEPVELRIELEAVKEG
jgi:mRNA-degrading endonuclease RelE of RelBE toxin-antitoxin system